jgi:hypothetical protein
MKKIECDFVKMKFHLNKNYVEWICIMQIELNATQLNLNSIKISKIEFNFFWIELKFLNWIKHNIHFEFKKSSVPIEIEFNLIILKTHWLNLFRLVWIQPNYKILIMKNIC